MKFNNLYLIWLISALIISYYVFWSKLFPISLFIITLLFFILIFTLDFLVSKSIWKIESIIFDVDNIEENIKKVKNWEIFKNANDQKLALEIIANYNKNLKYIIEKNNKIFIYSKKTIWEKNNWIIWKIVNIIENNKSILLLEISNIWITQEWEKNYKWVDIYWIKKINWPFWTKLSPENNSSEALFIDWIYSYNNSEQNNLTKNNELIYYELNNLPLSVNIIISIINNYMRKNKINFWNNK